MDNNDLKQMQKVLIAQQADVNKAEAIIQGLLEQIKRQNEYAVSLNSRYRTVLKHLICAAHERGANGILSLTVDGVKSVPDNAGIDIKKEYGKYVITPCYGEEDVSGTSDETAAAPADDTGNVLPLHPVTDENEGSDS